MKIGQLAQLGQVSADTIRYYEKLGLLRHASRNDNRYRDYGAHDVRALRFIISAKSLGFTLAEIKSMLPLIDQRQFTRGDLEQRLRRKITIIDKHLGKLAVMKANIETTLGMLCCGLDAKLGLEQATLPEEKIQRAPARARRQSPPRGASENNL